jgi:hypothetical protein
MDIPADILISVSASVITGILGYLGGHAVNKANAERTIGEAWDKYSSSLEQQLEKVTAQVNQHTDLIARQNQTIAEQNATIATQSARIAEQDKIILEQRRIITDLTKQIEGTENTSV